MNAEDHGANNAVAWWGSLKEMVDLLEDSESQGSHADEYRDAAERRIHESALSIEVRSSWYAPGQYVGESADTKPAEYRILLTTGGPALQLTGSLTEYGEPETAELEHQDWGAPWTRSFPYIHTRDGVEWDVYQETLLAFARCFYFGE